MNDNSKTAMVPTGRTVGAALVDAGLADTDTKCITISIPADGNVTITETRYLMATNGRPFSEINETWQVTWKTLDDAVASLHHLVDKLNQD